MKTTVKGIFLDGSIFYIQFDPGTNILLFYSQEPTLLYRTGKYVKVEKIERVNTFAFSATDLIIIKADSNRRYKVIVKNCEEIKLKQFREEAPYNKYYLTE